MDFFKPDVSVMTLVFFEASPKLSVRQKAEKLAAAAANIKKPAAIEASIAPGWWEVGSGKVEVVLEKEWRMVSFEKYGIFKHLIFKVVPSCLNFFMVDILNKKTKQN